MAMYTSLYDEENLEKIITKVRDIYARPHIKAQIAAEAAAGASTAGVPSATPFNQMTEQYMCHSSQPFCTHHVPGFGLVGWTPGPSKILSRWDGLLGCQAWVRRTPLYACGWIHLRMLAHA